MLEILGLRSEWCIYKQHMNLGPGYHAGMWFVYECEWESSCTTSWYGHCWKNWHYGPTDEHVMNTKIEAQPVVLPCEI